MTQFKVRFAKESDRETVLKFCEHTWQDSPDYIHLVWDIWFKDDRGKIFIVTNSEDIPIAMRRVVLMSENESWWEGFRVDPLYRQHFLAIISLVEKYINQYLLENNIKISRSCVWPNSKTMQAFTARRKKRTQIGKYALYKSQPIQSYSDRLFKLNLDDCEQIYSLITQYNYYPQSKANEIIYASLGDKCQELNKLQIEERIRSGKIWGLKEAKNIKNIAIESPTTIDRQQLWIGYICGEIETMSDFLIELKKLAYCQKCSNIGLFMPVRESILKSLFKAAYERAEKQDLFVYQWEN